MLLTYFDLSTYVSIKNGRNPQKSLPLLLLPLPFLLIVLLHPLVQLLPHFVEKVGAALVFAFFHIGIATVTIPNIHPEQRSGKRCQFVYRASPLLMQPISFSPYTSSTNSTAVPVHW